MPFDFSSRPSHFPLQTHPPSLSPPSIHIHTFSPHSCNSDKSGFLEKAASYGVMPSTAFVDVQFIIQTTWCAVSPHNDLGRPLECSKAQICSIIV